MGLKLSKFPVTSKSGNEYLIKIKQISPDGFDGLYVRLYIENQNKVKLFGVYVNEFKKVYSHTTSTFWNERAYYMYLNDLKLLAIDTVRDYESMHKDQKIAEEKAKNVLDEFNNWNGKCE